MWGLKTLKNTKKFAFSSFKNSNSDLKWTKIFATTSHDLFKGFCFASTSIFTAFFFENPLISSAFFAITSIHLLKFKTITIEIEKNSEEKLIKMKKSGIFSDKTEIFQIKNVEYVYSLLKDKVFLVIFQKEDRYSLYVIPLMEDEKNLEKSTELIKEFRGFSLK